MDQIHCRWASLRRIQLLCLSIVFACSTSPVVCAQQTPNRNAVYQQLRGLLPVNDIINVNSLELRRDSATFTFTRGDFAFYPEVNGKVTGAVFRGTGHLHLAPPTPEERHNLLILNKAAEFDEDFDQLVLRFTDDTAAELRKGSAGKAPPDAVFGRQANDLRSFQRLKLFENIDLRLLEDVLSPSQRGYFLAAIHGRTNGHLILTIDPHGSRLVAPEEVSLLSWGDDAFTYLTAFSSQAVAKTGAEGKDPDNGTYRIQHEDLDVTIEKSGFLTGLATTQITAMQDGLAVARLALYPTLRVSKVEDEKGNPLDFVQEKKDEDADFGVVLAKPLNKGETATVRIAYGGKDVVQNEGNANYYPVARESWYPNAARGLGDYATYNMQFHVPKGLQLIATGTKVSESTDGKITTSTWKTDVPLPVVGFTLGKFIMKEGRLAGKNGDSLTIDAYANTTVPDSYKAVDMEANLPSQGSHADESSVLQTLDTTGMLAAQLSQGQVAAQIYSNYFGPLPFERVALTQQFACNYGQSWPMLVYLPICGFFDQTQQHFMGLRPEDMYWKVVTPHEVAHQWWGQTVGFRSYRDQWMSEGFADTSASLFLQATRPKPDQFREFWRQQRKLLTEKNAFGFRPIDVGPVTMGFRLAAEKTGWSIYQNLVYPKGAYILHMVRMMMWGAQDGDSRFMATMSDFANTYRLRAATTEDFKAVVEKHMSPAMDLDGNHRMDWFFNEYVYGTDLPAYHFEGVAQPSGDGWSLHFKLTQSGVGAKFENLIPIYLEMEDGKFMKAGLMPIMGSTTSEQTFQLPKLQSRIKRVIINYYYDVLSTEN
jgi:Peptidase family M1 domain